VPVFGAAQEIGDAVAVEIDHGGADVVTFDILPGERLGRLEVPLPSRRPICRSTSAWQS